MKFDSLGMEAYRKKSKYYYSYTMSLSGVQEKRCSPLICRVIFACLCSNAKGI